MTGTAIKSLEVRWLKATILYEVFDADPGMSDHAWDALGKELHERRLEWSPYFANSIPGGREGDFNPGTTGSGIDWSKGTARVFYEFEARRLRTDPLGLLYKVTPQ